MNLSLLAITRLSHKRVCIYRDNDSRRKAGDRAGLKFETTKKALSVKLCLKKVLVSKTVRALTHSAILAVFL